MKIQDALSKVNELLLDQGLDSEAPTVKAFSVIADYIQVQSIKLESLEDIDEIAGKYRDLAEEAITEYQAHVECGSSIDYGNADKLRNKFEELSK